MPSTNEAGNHQDILWWQDTYQAMDWLFIGTGPGERFAHDQLSRFDSELSTDGRELARTLEKKVRVPVYYYLWGPRRGLSLPGSGAVDAQTTALGIRNAFVNQPVEEPRLRHEFAKALGLGDRRPDLVVRFGRGKEMPRSLRRPVESVLI